MRTSLSLFALAGVFVVTSVAAPDASANPGTAGAASPATANTGQFKKGLLGKSLKGKKDTKGTSARGVKMKGERRPVPGADRHRPGKGAIRQSAKHPGAHGSAVMTPPQAIKPGDVKPGAKPRAGAGAAPADSGKAGRPAGPGQGGKLAPRSMVKGGHPGLKTPQFNPKGRRGPVARPAGGPLQGGTAAGHTPTLGAVGQSPKNGAGRPDLRRPDDTLRLQPTATPSATGQAPTAPTGQ